MCVRTSTVEKTLAGELAQEFLLVHVILEGLAAVDEYNRNFVVELAPELVVCVYVDFAPGESSAAGELGKALLHHFAEVTPFARINYDTP